MDGGAETRVKALDGLRGLAVLQVVAYHYYLLLPIDAGWYRTLQRLGNAVDGVTLFFVLSGFLIGGILLDKRESPGLFRVFYGRRICRILPLYGLLLATYAAIRLADEQWRWGFIYYWYLDFPFWSYLAFWQNDQMTRYAALGPPWLAVTWSLAVEQQFYLIIPWVVRYVANRRTLLALCGAAMMASALHRGGVVGIPMLLIDRLDALAVGVGLALFMRDELGRKIIAQGRNLLRLLVSLYFLGLLALRMTDTPCPPIDNLLTACVIYALLIGLLTDRTPWRAVGPTLEALASIGLWSYFIYLFHMPVVIVFRVWWPEAVLAALPVTCALAAISYRYFELPLIRWGHRLTYRRPESRPEPAGV